MPVLKKIGLTGGIGSGKSAAAAEFEKLGAAIIDSDALAHQITAPGGSAMPAILSQFGEAFVNSDGSLNRSKMREFVFDNPNALKQLEAITHPLIKEAGEKAASLAASQNPSYLIFMIPLLFESNRWEGRFDKIVTIDCPEEQQIERVMRRNQLTREAVEKIIRAQVPRALRIQHADFVINNGSSLEMLKAQVQSVHQGILKG